MNLDKILRVAGIMLLFAVIGWAFYIHIPALDDGYLNAGDDHIHVAFSNELKKIWQEEGRLLGWSRLYAAGAPIFLLRPPGFYQFVLLVHSLSGLTVEESLKLTVIFGFCLFPLTFFIGARLLGVGFAGSLFAAILSPMGISLWGHTLDAYQHLGVYKQLTAILFFPILTGAFWQVLKHGKYGLLYALSFSVVFLSHPYIAYCFALLIPLMLFALLTIEPQWNWKRGILGSVLWSIPLILWVGIWLLPFVTSQEIQIYNPYLDRREDFDVVVLTTADTLRQYFLGGILDTTQFAGPFGDHEWGWRDNSALFRLPLITILSFIGWLLTAIKPKNSIRGFMALAFIAALILFTGPDDFPFLERIPFAEQFQNIHAVFLFEWAAFILAGVAVAWLFKICSTIKKNNLKYSAYCLMGASLYAAYGTVVYERTKTAQKMIDLRNVYTTNGSLTLREKIDRQWWYFDRVVQKLNGDMDGGSVAAFPLEHEDSVLYNLLPLMVDRQVFLSGFEKMGGVYDLLVKNFRPQLRDNYSLQRLFDIRFVVNSPYHRKVKMKWHDSVEPVLENEYWELVKVKGDYGIIESIHEDLVGFAGNEEEWTELMRIWLTARKDGDSSMPWIINVTHSGLRDPDLEKIRPFIRYLILGKGSLPPAGLSGIKSFLFNALKTRGRKLSKADLTLPGEGILMRGDVNPVQFEQINWGRKREVFRVMVEGGLTPVVFKRAFYRGWRAEIDDQNIAIYRVSPGLQLLLVPGGEHFISWRYHGPNNRRLALIFFCLGFVIAFILVLRHRGKGVDRERPDAGLNGVRPYRSYIVSALCAAFVAVVTVQVISEAYYKTPVIIRPRNNDTFKTGSGDFNWNYLVGVPKKDQKFLMEVAHDKEFKNIFKTKTVADSRVKIQKGFNERGPYYFRVRAIINGKKHQGTRPVKFYGRGIIEN